MTNRRWEPGRVVRWNTALEEPASSVMKSEPGNSAPARISDDADTGTSSRLNSLACSILAIFIKPHENIIEPELRRRTKLLSALLLITIVFAVVSFILTFLDIDSRQETLNGHLFVIFTSFLLLAGVYVLSRTQKAKLAVTLAVSIILFAASAATLIEPSAAPFQVLGVILASIFLTSKKTLYVLGVTVLLQLGIILRIPAPIPADVLNATFLILVAGVFVVAGAHLHQTDIEQIHSQAHVLAHHAAHDALTRLPNRMAAIETLKDTVAYAKGASQPLCLTFVDLEDFKNVNDTFGHQAGDHVLHEVASRLHESIRAEDFVGRFGGDEFMIISGNLGCEHTARSIVERILNKIREPMPLDGTLIHVGAHAGIAFASQNRTPAELLRMADAALYRAKTSGVTTIEVYDTELEHELLGNEEIERDLKATLRRGGDELRLHYQPIIETNTGTIVAIEALVRWLRPGIGLMTPDSFIPVSERSSLIIDLDRWVIRNALRQFAEWKDTPRLSGARISVNISGKHVLDSRFFDHIKRALSETGLPGERLVLEITETTFITDMKRATEQLNRIRKLGVGIAIDDFGTGFASIAHLRSLPINEIKIDRSLITEMLSTKNSNMVKLVHDIAHYLDAYTVAEGVETEDERSVLVDVGCTALQGYLFTRPLDPKAFIRWIEQEPVDSLASADGTVSPPC